MKFPTGIRDTGLIVYTNIGVNGGNTSKFCRNFCKSGLINDICPNGKKSLTKYAGFVITQSLLNSFINRLENCTAVERTMPRQSGISAEQAAKLSAAKR